jgi:hypothetical protein
MGFLRAFHEARTRIDNHGYTESEIAARESSARDAAAGKAARDKVDVKRERKPVAFEGMILVGIVLFIPIGLWLSPTPSRLPAGAGILNGMVTIENQGPDELLGCRVVVNGSLWAGDFNIQPAPGYIQIGWLQFADSDGLRFNPFQYRMNHLGAFCSMPDGTRRSASRSF